MEIPNRELPIVCPRCAYQRRPADTAPDWQCPRCGVAYIKAAQYNESAGVNHGAPSGRHPASNTAYRYIQRLLTGVLVVAALLTLAAYLKKGELPGSADMVPDVLQSPIQKTIEQQRFTFDYIGENYLVETVAGYELWGLVVSHNDITGISDIYHDESSIDTKDLCVIWGENLKTDAFRRVEYWSGSWTCYFRYPAGVTFRGNQLSNNHLITASRRIRDIIDTVRIGDQVHLKGMLVNYRPQSRPEFWRRTSTTREDSGNTACEVVFVEQLDVLKKGTPGWYLLYTIGLWTMLAAIVLKGAALFIDSGPRGQA